MQVSHLHPIQQRLVAHHVLVHPDNSDPVEPGRVSDQDLAALGQNSVFGGVSADRRPLGGPGHGEMLAHGRSSAQPNPRRDSFARGSPARVVSWRHTCPQPLHR